MKITADLRQQLGQRLFEMVNPKDSWLHQPPMISRSYISAAVSIYLEGAAANGNIADSIWSTTK